MRPPIWTDEKVDYLKRRFNKMSKKKLAEELEVSKQSLLHKATMLGLQCAPVVSKKRRLKADMETKQTLLGWDRTSIFYRESNPVRQMKCVIDSSDNLTANEVPLHL